MMFTIEEFKESDQSNTKAFVLSIVSFPEKKTVRE